MPTRRLDDGRLDRPYVRDERVGREIRREPRERVQARLRGRRKDDEFGPSHGIAKGKDFVCKSLRHSGFRDAVHVYDHDVPRHARSPQGRRERSADQSGSNEGKRHSERRSADQKVALCSGLALKEGLGDGMEGTRGIVTQPSLGAPETLRHVRRTLPVPTAFPMRRLLLAAGAAAAGHVLYHSAVRLNRRVSFDGARVLILGGGRGLGLELARTFAAQGAQLALVARSQGQLDTAAALLRNGEGNREGATVHARALDLRGDGAAREAVEWAAEAMGGLDVLVNVAGLIQVGPLEHLTPKDYDDAMRIHFWAPLQAMEAALPYLKRSGVARVVNISSIAGKVASPHLISYTASKFALSGLSDALRAAYRRYGIFVTTVHPGLMRTGSARNAGFKGDAEAEFGWFAPRIKTPVSSIDATRAARQIVEAAQVGRGRLTITFQARLLHLFDTLMPELAADAMGLFEKHYLPAPVGPEGDRLVMGYDGPEAANPDASNARVVAAVRHFNQTNAPQP